MYQSLEERQGRRGAATKVSWRERAGLRLRGTPACPGCVVAPARVVTTISQAEKIRPGDILVTSSTGQSAGTSQLVATQYQHQMFRYRLESLLSHPGRSHHRAGRPHLSRRRGGPGVRPALPGGGRDCHGAIPGWRNSLSGRHSGCCCQA